MRDLGLAALERDHIAEPACLELAEQLAQRYLRVGRSREAYRVCQRAALTPPDELLCALAAEQRLALRGLGAPDAQVATRRVDERWHWRDLLSDLERPEPRPLRALNLPWRRLQPAGLSAIASLITLEELGLSGWEPASGPRLRLLAPLRELRALALDYTALGDADLEALREFPRLESLSLAHCTQLSGRALAPLAELTSLRSLDLSFTRADAEGLDPLRSHPTLSELRLQDCQAIGPPALAVFLELPRLRRLDLSFCQGLPRLARAELSERRPELVVV